MDQKEIIKRILHIQDLKITLLTMSLNQIRLEHNYNMDQVYGNGFFNYQKYAELKNNDKEIEEQIKIINSDIEDLLNKV